MRVYKISGSFEEAVAAVKAIGWTPLFKPEDYLGVSKKLRMRCSCGNELNTSLQKLSKHGECAACKGTKTPNSRKVVTRDGEFVSIAAASRFYGIAHGCLVSRLRLGWTDDEACGLVPREINQSSRDPDAMGFIYRLRNKQTGLVYIGLTSTTPERRWKGHLKDAKAGSMQPLHQAIREFGADAFELKCLKAATVRELPDLERKYMKKYNSEEAGYNGCPGGGIGGPTLGYEIEHGGKKYVSLRAFADAHSFNYELTRKIFQEEGDMDRVYAECVRRSQKGYHLRKAITVHGIEYASVTAAAKALGVDRNQVRGRLGLGWTPEDAFARGTFTKATSPSLNDEIVYKGTAYRSLGILARSTGLNLGLVKRRLGLGWTLERALSKEKFTRAGVPNRSK